MFSPERKTAQIQSSTKAGRRFDNFAHAQIAQAGKTYFQPSSLCHFVVGAKVPYSLGQSATYAKSQKGVIFLLAQKAKAKIAKRSDKHDLGKKQKRQKWQIAPAMGVTRVA